MPAVTVHLLPELTSPERLAGGVVVIIDVLRATTTIVQALASGCQIVIPCLELEEARKVANELPAGKVILGGERDSVKPIGFDLGNSPREYTSSLCRDTTLVLTTTNGTRAMLMARLAARVLIGAFVNFSAICEQLKNEKRPIHILCAGHAGEIALEDTLLAGAIVDFLCEKEKISLNDAARLAWDCFDLHGTILEGALEVCAGGMRLSALGFNDDIKAAARVDSLTLVPELRFDPVRIEVNAIITGKNYWKWR